MFPLYWLAAAMLSIAMFFVCASAAQAASRLALVIGNSDYPQWPLVNPVNDANAMSKKLTQLGFDVSTHLQLQRDDIGIVTDAFLRKVSPEDTVVFFFAGHGVQVGGQNFLLATDAKIRTEYDVHRNGIDFSRFLGRLERTRAAVKLIFLDACRNNPFAQKLRGSGSQEGLARVGGAPYGTLISFATQPGGVAADGTGRHGLYTEQLLAHIDEPGLPVEQVLKRVSASTYRESNGQQRPWIEGSLYGDFVFNKKAPTPVAVQPKNDYAKMAWTYAADANTRAAYEAFLREYPDSPYGALARIKMATLQRTPRPAPAKVAQREVKQAKPPALPAAQPVTRPVTRPATRPAPVAAAPATPVAKGRVQTLNASTPPLQPPVVTKPVAKKPPAQVASVDTALTGASSRPDVAVSDDSAWDLATLNGRKLTAVKDAPFDVQLTVDGNKLVVDYMKWKELPSDAEGADNLPLRCGFFSSSLSVSDDGSVQGSCSAGHITVRVRGTIRQLQMSGSYLAGGGTSQAPAVQVRMTRP